MRKHDRAIARAIELAPEIMAEEKGMPLAGTVAAGLTTLAFEQAERVDFAQMFSKKSLFALKVKGDSMIDAQIADGDYVVVKKQKTAQPGQMVVAQTPGRRGDAEVLAPRSQSHSPAAGQFFDAADLRQGGERAGHRGRRGAEHDSISQRDACQQRPSSCWSIDRLGAGWLGPYGNTWLDTPNFNRLAAQSLLVRDGNGRFARFDASLPRLLDRPARDAAGGCAGVSRLPNLAARGGARTVLVTDDPRSRRASARGRLCASAQLVRHAAATGNARRRRRNRTVSPVQRRDRHLRRMHAAARCCGSIRAA